jgi:hypothetical protein
MARLHRITHRTVTIHRGQTDRRHGVDPAHFDQRQIRPRALRVADEPFVQRRLIHNLVGVANANADPVRDHVRGSQHRPPRHQTTRPIPRGDRSTPVRDHLDHPGSQRQLRQRLTLQDVSRRGDLHRTAIAIHRSAEHHCYRLLRTALPADAAPNSRSTMGTLNPPCRRVAIAAVEAPRRPGEAAQGRTSVVQP